MYRGIVIAIIVSGLLATGIIMAAWRSGVVASRCHVGGDKR